MLKKVNFNSRIAELDFFKGFAVIFMILNHLMYDIGHIFYDEFSGTAFDRIAALCSTAHGDDTFRLLTYALCAEIFVISSGIVSTFAKHTVREGAVLAALAACITGVTLITSRIIDVNTTIWFGIFHLLALCMLISPLLKKLPVAALLPLAVAVFALGLYFETIVVYDRSLSFLAIFNFRCVGFVSSDYYPILPHTAFYILGVFIGKVLYRSPSTKLKFTNKKLFKPIRFLGAYSFEVYVVHQPILLAILFIVTRFI